MIGAALRPVCAPVAGGVTVGGGAIPPPDPGEWAPLDLGASLLAWWDASQGLTLSGSQVSDWTDRKDGLVVSQATASKRPVVQETGFGGAQGIYFDGVDDALLAGTHPFPINSDGSEIWAVVRQDKPGSETGTINAAAYGNRLVSRASVGSVNRGRLDQSPVVTDNNTDFSSSHLIRGRFGSPNKVLTIDTTTPISTLWGSATEASAFAMGAHPGGASQFWKGPIRDIIVTLPLTTQQAASLAAFLMPRRQI